MIIGKIQDLNKFKGISNNINTAIEWLEKTDILNLPVGKYEIDGKNVYANRQSYLGKDVKDCKAENHDFYMDLQIVIKGSEGFGYADILNPSLKVLEPYNEVKDVTKYTVDDEIVYVVNDNHYALVFKEDIHRPQIKINDNQIEKLVLKIKIDF